MFTQVERDFVFAHYKIMSYSKIGKALGRTKNSVLAFATRNGLRKRNVNNA
jgi:hypothetical protein